MPEESLTDLSRRRLVKVGTAAALGIRGTTLAGQSVVSKPPEEDKPQLEFLMEIALDVPGGKSTHVVGFPGGERMTVSVTGGTFQGPKLKGIALAPSGDWLVRRPDGSSVLDVRTTLQTDDEQLIYLSYRGIMYTPKGGKLYWRTIPMFETGAEKYAWLNHIVCVGTGVPTPGKAVYRIFQVL
jgi:Protein of unknown function (DUF3237)